MTCRDLNLDSSGMRNPRYDQHSLPRLHCHIKDRGGLSPEAIPKLGRGIKVGVTKDISKHQWGKNDPLNIT